MCNKKKYFSFFFIEIFLLRNMIILNISQLSHNNHKLKMGLENKCLTKQNINKSINREEK